MPRLVQCDTENIGFCRADLKRQISECARICPNVPECARMCHECATECAKCFCLVGRKLAHAMLSLCVHCAFLLNKLRLQPVTLAKKEPGLVCHFSTLNTGMGKGEGGWGRGWGGWIRRFAQAWSWEFISQRPGLGGSHLWMFGGDGSGVFLWW